MPKCATVDVKVRACRPSGALIPEVLPAAPPEIATANLPSWIKPEWLELLDTIRATHQAAAAAAKRWVLGVVMCGVQLRHLRQQVGAGRWPAFQALCVEPCGISDRTLQRYIQIADGVRRAIARGAGGVDPSRLLESAQPLDDRQLQEIMDAIAQVTDATCWKDLLEDVHLMRPQARGGFHPPVELLRLFAQEHGLDEACYSAWTDEQKQAFRAWLKARIAAEKDAEAAAEKMRRKAERQWTPVLDLLRAGLDGRDHWKHLDQPQRQELAEGMRQMAERIEATLK
jgi:hypothetical protein